MTPLVRPAYSLNPTAVILRGVFSIIFGILALLMPAAALLTIALVYGAYALVDGAFAVATGVRLGREHRPWGWPIFEGLLGLAAGIVTWAWPGITILVLSIMAGAWAVTTGAVELIAAFRIPKALVGAGSKWLLGVAGLASIALGALIFGWPGLGAAVLIKVVAVYALVFGALQLGLGRRLRRATVVPEVPSRQAA